MQNAPEGEPWGASALQAAGPCDFVQGRLFDSTVAGEATLLLTAATRTRPDDRRPLQLLLLLLLLLLRAMQ